MNATSTRKSGDPSEPRSVEEHIFEVCAFLVTAARGCVDEPHMYGPMRLMDAVSRLADIYSKDSDLSSDSFLVRMKKEIDGNLFYLDSDEEFVAFVDKIVLEFTDEIRRRYGDSLEEPKP